LYKLGDIEQAEYITERADIHNKLEALKPSQVPEMEEAAAALQQIGALLKRAKPEELEILFHSMLTTVYLHHDYPGYVVGIEPKPFLKELMDISMLPTWKPPHGMGSATDGDDDDPEPDPDGGGQGENWNEDEGEFVWSGNNGIMTDVDAGEDHRVAVTGMTPVAPALGGNIFRNVFTLFNFPGDRFKYIRWYRQIFIQDHAKVTMQRDGDDLSVINKHPIYNLSK
jgi:hypothetical protein